MNSLYLRISVKPITFGMPKCISINNICIDPDSKNMFWGVLQNLIYANTFPTNQRALKKNNCTCSPLATIHNKRDDTPSLSTSAQPTFESTKLCNLDFKWLSTRRKNYSATKISEEADFCTCLYALTIELFSKNM